MEDFSKTNSTSGTGVYFNSIFKPLDIKATQPIQSQDYEISQEKSQPHSLLQSIDQYSTLSTKTNILAIQVQRVNQQNQRILQDCGLEQATRENIGKYQQVSKYNADVQKQLKMKINTQTAKLDRQIQQLYKNRLIYTKQSDKQIKEQIQDLKQLQQKSLTLINKQMKIKFQEMKHQANQLKKQTIIYKKQNVLFKQQLFGKLNSIRAKLNSQILEEQQKRKSYDDIVQNLLQKSCTKAQQSLRRRLY